MNAHDEITFLQSEIGRGHPFYLDGVIEQLKALRMDRAVKVLTTRDIAHGLPRITWPALAWMYRRGSSGGPAGFVYSWFRNNVGLGGGALSLALLGRRFRRERLDPADTMVVAHPILVSALAGHRNLIYQHGELVAPDISLVAGATTVMVPTETVAEAFVRAGYSRRQIFVSGLCIEPAAVSEAAEAYRRRSERRAQAAPLRGLFVSSGAEPQHHVRYIISSITSCVGAGVSAVVLARKGGRLEREIRTAEVGGRVDVTSLRDQMAGSPKQPECAVVAHETRSEESVTTAMILPHIDFFVAPSHERSNWAMGLGLPMFALTPCIGPFAPLNLSLLEDSGTTLAIKSDRDAACLGKTVTKLRESGQLARMAECGWGRYRIDGFEQIARFLATTA